MTGRYVPATLDGIPNWIACLHVGMVETGRAVSAVDAVYQYWCPDCGAHKTVQLRRG